MLMTMFSCPGSESVHPRPPGDGGQDQPSRDVGVSPPSPHKKSRLDGLQVVQLSLHNADHVSPCCPDIHSMLYWLENCIHFVSSLRFIVFTFGNTLSISISSLARKMFNLFKSLITSHLPSLVDQLIFISNSEERCNYIERFICTLLILSPAS